MAQPERITLTPYKPVLVGDRLVSIGGKRPASLLVWPIGVTQIIAAEQAKAIRAQIVSSCQSEGIRRTEKELD